jgi:hypothetical protein
VLRAIRQLDVVHVSSLPVRPNFLFADRSETSCERLRGGLARSGQFTTMATYELAEQVRTER